MSIEQDYQLIEFFRHLIEHGIDNMPQRFRHHLLGFVTYGVIDKWFERSLSVKDCRAVTLEKCTTLYGDIEGAKRWEVYRNKQATTNTFEYKNKRYGMSREEFDQYNRSRAVTLPNMILRHGMDVGARLYADYCELQKTAGVSLQYFQNKYGQIEGTKKHSTVCSSKALTLSNFIRKYGETEGPIRFEEVMGKLNKCYSEKSQTMFWSMYSMLQSPPYVYFATLNKEFGIYDADSKSYRSFDFTATDIKLAVEFDGDHYHGNPSIYAPSDRLKGRGCNHLTATESWEHDKWKQSLLEQRGFTVLRVWESEYDADPIQTVKRVVDEYRSRKNIKN